MTHSAHVYQADTLSYKNCYKWGQIWNGKNQEGNSMEARYGTIHEF